MSESILTKVDSALGALIGFIGWPMSSIAAMTSAT